MSSSGPPAEAEKVLDATACNGKRSLAAALAWRGVVSVASRGACVSACGGFVGVSIGLARLARLLVVVHCCGPFTSKFDVYVIMWD